MRSTPVTTHDTDALGRLIEQFKQATKLKQIISVFTTQVQELEDLLAPFFDRLNIDVSEGTQLDNLGAIVGIEREGRSDAVYRLFIKGKIATNTSEGTPENLIDVFKILVGGGIIFIVESFPAEVSLMSTVLITSGLEASIKTIVEDAAAAAVSVGSIGFYEEDTAFSFDGSSEGLGFGRLREQGTNTSTATNKLIDSAATFQTNLVATGDIVYNDTDETTATVVSVDSETQVTLDAGIFTGTGKDYYISDSTVGGEFGFIYNV